MTGTDLCVNKPQLVPVIFEPPSIFIEQNGCKVVLNDIISASGC